MAGSIAKLVDRNVSLWSARQRALKTPPKGSALRVLVNTDTTERAWESTRASEPPLSGVRHRVPQPAGKQG